jgi:hypothetical protein
VKEVENTEKKSVILVSILVIVAFLSGKLATSYGITPATKPVPTLHTRLVTQSVPFSKVWNLTACGVATPLFNFTITLAGKDAGSDWVDFKPTPFGNFSVVNVALVFNSINIPALGCPNITEPVVLSATIFSGGSGSGDNYWRVLQPGNYTYLDNTFGFARPTPLAVESWTVTTLG